MRRRKCRRWSLELAGLEHKTLVERGVEHLARVWNERSRRRR